jgi:hypothetical protein
LVGLKQKECESLQDCTKQFETSRDVLQLHIGGPLILTKYITTMKEYGKIDATTVMLCAEQAYQQLLANMYLDKSNKAKYETLIN